MTSTASSVSPALITLSVTPIRTVIRFFLLYKNEADREREIKVEERQFVVAGSRFTLGLDNTS